MGGGGGVTAPPPPDPGKEYSSAIQAYIQNAPALYGEEAQYQPQYNQLQQGMEQSNLNLYGARYMQMMPQMQAAQNQVQGMATGAQARLEAQTAPGASQALMASSPQFGQLAGYATSQLGATPNAMLTGIAGQLAGAAPSQAQGFYNLAGQAATQLQPINQQLGGLANQALVGANQQAAQLGNVQQQVMQNARSDIFNQTKGNVMGALGNLDPLTQQLQNTAQQQLALGGQMSGQMATDVAQQERAAYQARGMLQSTGSIGAEIMGQQQMQQQLLQQREQFASGVSPLVQNELQQRTQNALGLTSTDIAATQANQQLAGQLGQGIAGIQQAGIGLAGGLQGQIAQNLQNAISQQGGLIGQAVSAQQAGLTGAAGIQQAALQQQLAQQQQGAGAAQYLTGAQQSNLQNLLGYAPSGAQLAQAGAGLNQYGTGGPSLFQSSGVLPMVAQNQAQYYNALMGAQMSNASAGAASAGSTMGMIGSIGGAAIGAGGLLL